MKTFFTRAAHAAEDVEGIEPTLLQTLRPPRGVVAVATLQRHGEAAIATTAASTTEIFEIGSVTKTVTATALARMVIDGQLSLDTTVGDLLGPKSGRAAGLTMLQLATQTSGLPKLPPNAMRPPFWPRDPYRFYDEARLWRGLASVELVDQGKFRYSNLGFSLLGVCLGIAAGAPIAEVLTEKVLRPAGMVTARCQPCTTAGLLRGHGHWLMAGRRWHQPLPGAGGIDGSITDLAAWTSANLRPDSTPLGDAVRLAQRTHHEEENVWVGLAWINTKGTIWHNGGTGGFSSFVGLRSDRAICALASHSATRGFSLDPHAHSFLNPRSEADAGQSP